MQLACHEETNLPRFQPLTSSRCSPLVQTKTCAGFRLTICRNCASKTTSFRALIVPFTAPTASGSSPQGRILQLLEIEADAVARPLRRSSSTAKKELRDGAETGTSGLRQAGWHQAASLPRCLLSARVCLTFFSLPFGLELPQYRPDLYTTRKCSSNTFNP